tara:strand:+ start:279 stop:488 length:210 start_codon:yes stop_codon:yes gene_type:complete
MSKQLDSKNAENSNELYTLLGCVFCYGTGMAKYVDIDEMPDGTSMVMGDETWLKNEKIGACPEGCEMLN